jgi:hypothetical protein
MSPYLGFRRYGAGLRAALCTVACGRERRQGGDPAGLHIDGSVVHKGQTTSKLQALQKRHLQKNKQCTMRRHRPIKILGFHTEDSSRSQNNASNKVITGHNQLRPSLGFLP